MKQQTTKNIKDVSYDDSHIQKQWEKWRSDYLEEFDKEEPIDTNELQKELTDELTFLSGLSQEEYVLYKKWLQLREKYPVRSVSTLFGEEYQFNNIENSKLISALKDNIWVPDSYEDYEKLEPRLVNTSSSFETERPWKSNPRLSKLKLAEVYSHLRSFLSTFRSASNPGKGLRFVAYDDVTKKFLGIINVSGDFLDLKIRNDYIGWTNEQRLEGMIEHTMIGSTIVPTQPLGFNYVGGKLISLLVLSDKVRDDWYKQYNKRIVGVTTTSLYGKNKGGHGLSQYDQLKPWKKMGYSPGTLPYEPEKRLSDKMKLWLKQNQPQKYFELWKATRISGMTLKRMHSSRSRTAVYSALKIPNSLRAGEQSRGVYFAEIYENTRDFLNETITEDALVKKQFDFSEQGISDLWKRKYARKRLNSLRKQNRLMPKDEILFYDDLCFMETWDEVREKYINQVGR